MGLWVCDEREGRRLGLRGEAVGGGEVANLGYEGGDGEKKVDTEKVGGQDVTKKKVGKGWRYWWLEGEVDSEVGDKEEGRVRGTLKSGGIFEFTACVVPVLPPPPGTWCGSEPW